MARFALGVEYIGSRYYGWQQQSGLDTVQNRLEQALSRVADTSVTVICAGRTDKGVHATGQVVHFDTEIKRNQHAWLMGTNTYLPQDIRVQWVKEVDNNFHARFSATARRYHYYIFNAPVKSALHYQRMTWHFPPLDYDKMQQAANYLLGEHDFSAFRDASCQAKTPVREVQHIALYRQQPHIILMDIQANAFLHHMVRNIVGMLYLIGEGKRPPEWAAEVLISKSRKLAGITAPPDGLYLVDVTYPELFALPKGVCPGIGWVSAKS